MTWVGETSGYAVHPSAGITKQAARRERVAVSSAADARLQQFVNKFRASPKYTPEYGAPCTGGLGTPLQK